MSKFREDILARLAIIAKMIPGVSVPERRALQRERSDLEEKLREGFSMIRDAHYHESPTVLTLCWYDGPTYKERYLEGQAMLDALAKLHAEESRDGLTRALHKLIGEVE